MHRAESHLREPRRLTAEGCTISLSLLLVMMGALAACGGGGSNGTPDADLSADADVDAPADAPGACDPLAAAGQQGCASGQKCTWIELQTTPDVLGKLGCVADGTGAIGGACTRGEPGETTGFDTCAAGGICIGTVCKDVCGFDASAAAACTAGEACTRYAGLGANGADDPVIGACNQTCDPLKQTRIVNGMVTNCGTGQGCYTLSNAIDTIAVCAGAGTLTHNQPITGTTFANSCAPGHIPRQAVQGMTGDECTAFCKPADVYMGNNEAFEGGNANDTNFANLPATCESAGGATVLPGVPGTGESCQYFWTREASPDLSTFSNTLGWCFNHASWQYDADGQAPIVNDTPYPRCITLTTGDVVPPVDPANPHNDALYFGCIAIPPAFQLHPIERPHARKLDRLGSYKQ